MISGGILVVLSLFTFIVFGNWVFSTKLSEEKVAQFGDFIGGVVGTIMSLAGVILFYVALNEQRKDIKINQRSLAHQVDAMNKQIEEYKGQKAELVITREIYEKQYKSIVAQQFEASYYSILRLFLELKKNPILKNNDESYFRNLYQKIEIQAIEATILENQNLREKAISIYKECIGSPPDELLIYFKLFDNLLESIESATEIDEKKKLGLIRVLTATLDDNEIIVLYYRYQSLKDNRLRSLTYKYELFKDLFLLNRIEYVIVLKKIHKDNTIIAFVKWFIELIELYYNKGKNIEEQRIDREDEFQESDIFISILIDNKVYLKMTIEKVSRHFDLFSGGYISRLLTILLYDFFYTESSIGWDNIKYEESIDEEKKILNYTIKM